MPHKKAKNRDDVSGSEAVGRRLLHLREALGPQYSQAFMAKLAEITPQAWNNCERGSDRIGLNAALRLCRQLGHHRVTLLWIYEGKFDLMDADLREKIMRLQFRAGGGGSDQDRHLAPAGPARSPDP